MESKTLATCISDQLAVNQRFAQPLSGVRWFARTSHITRDTIYLLLLAYYKDCNSETAKGKRYIWQRCVGGRGIREMARSFQHLGVYTHWEALWISLFKSFYNQVSIPLHFLGVRGGGESSHPLTGWPFLSPAPGLRYLGAPAVSPPQCKLQSNGKWPLMNSKDTAITRGLPRVLESLCQEVVTKTKRTIC